MRFRIRLPHLDLMSPAPPSPGNTELAFRDVPVAELGNVRYAPHVAKSGSKSGVRVAREIVQSIYEKGLAPGDRYLSEQDALREHAVSRATFREATRFLEFQGVVSTKAGPGGGTVVASPDWRNLASTLALLMQFSGTSLAQVLEARRVIEPVMVRASARHVTADQLRYLERCLTEAREQVAEVDRFVIAYRDFWSCVADAAANPVIAELWKALRAIVDSGGFVPNEVYRQQLTVRLGHLLEALASRDEDRASAVIVEHDSDITERLERDYPKRTSRIVSWSDV